MKLHPWFSAHAFVLIFSIFSAAMCKELSLDSVVECAEKWQTTTPDRVTLAIEGEETHGTAKSLHFTWKKDLGNIAGTGLPTAPQLPICWMELPADLDLSKFTRFTFWAKISGTRHGHLHVAFSNKPAFWGKDVKNHINNSPLDAGDWSQYQVTLGHIDPFERKTYHWMGIGSISVGHQPDESDTMHVWLDDFVFTDTPLRKWKGWGADPTVVIVSQAGFRRFHQKLAVIDGANNAQEFIVCDAASDAKVYNGSLKPLKSAVGSYKIADFTTLTKPGRYSVQAGALKSLPFTIGDDAFTHCIEMLDDWIFNMRCGCATALHAPCHLDDATFVRYQGEGKDRKEISRQHLDLVGGWHDAGDVRTYYNYSYWMAHQSLRTRECGWGRDRNKDGVDDLMDSALWAMRHMLKLRNPDDSTLLFKIEDWPDYRRGNYWTDNKIGTPDDRHVMHPPELVEYVGLACASAGLFARVAGKDYPQLAAAGLKLAEERWNAWLNPASGKIRWREKPIMVDHGHGYNVAKLGQGSLQLYLATKKPIYLDFARYAADTIMSYQRRVFYPNGPRPMCGEIFSWVRTFIDRDLPEEFLADLMLELPDSPDYLRWRAALVRAAHWWMKPTREYWQPFALPHLEVPVKEFKEGYFGVPLERGTNNEVVRYLLPTAGWQQLGDTAHAIQRVAQALNDLELERLARWQVQWAVGHNPFNVSWICRFGGDSIDQFYSFSQGRMPGCVSGFGLDNNGVPMCVRPYGGEPYTSPGVRLLRAMIATNEPARLRLTLRNGTEPWSGQVYIKWPITGETVFAGRPDAAGQLSEIKLDGGQRYELICGDAVLPLPVISGTVYERTIDLAHLLVLSANAPPTVKPNTNFTIELFVHNIGLSPLTTHITAYAEDAISECAMHTVELAQGESKRISWPFKAGEATRPYIVIFGLMKDQSAYLDVTGAILP